MRDHSNTREGRFPPTVASSPGMSASKIALVQRNNPLVKAKNKMAASPRATDDDAGAARQLTALNEHLEAVLSEEDYEELQMKCSNCDRRRFVPGETVAWVVDDEDSDDVLCPSCSGPREGNTPALARSTEEEEQSISGACAVLRMFEEHLAQFDAAWLKGFNLECMICSRKRFAPTNGDGEWSTNDYGDNSFAVCPACFGKCAVCQRPPQQPVDECCTCSCGHPVCDACPLVACSSCGGTTCKMCPWYDQDTEACHCTP